MVKTFKKGSGVQISEHFNLSEFDCRCQLEECKTTLLDTNLVVALEMLRLATGPITVSSGYRCGAHNADVGGVLNSFHRIGKAADIETPLSPFETARLASKVPDFHFGGIGVYPAFVHVDTRGAKARWKGGQPH